MGLAESAGPPDGLFSITVSDPPIVSRSLCGPIPRHSPPEPQKQERRTHERQYTELRDPHELLTITGTGTTTGF